MLWRDKKPDDEYTCILERGTRSFWKDKVAWEG